ncbi:MAG: RND transporter [Acidobacteria bacterium]|nr:MAG: RND transporter [Acidobacteriota bacterium]
MDIVRPSGKRKRLLRQASYISLGLLAVALGAAGVSRLKPAMPTVDRSTVFIDAVKRGPMLRQVRGQGTLVAEDERWIPAPVAGRVERVLIQPGTQVTSETVLIELTTPELQQSAQDADYQLKAAEADYKNLKVKLDSERLSQEAVVATVQAEYKQGKLQLDTDEELAKDGLLPELNLKLSRVRAEEVANRYRIEQQRLAATPKSALAQLEAQQARAAQYKALVQLRHAQVESLRVRAGTAGVLQQVSVEVGQQVTPGANLARVADPKSLKAQLKIVESQAKDVQVNQLAEIELEGVLPKGARPDLSVEGTIELERLKEVLYVGRPSTGPDQSTVALFKIEDGSQSATRVQVALGRSSVNTVEILSGLKEGDQVILSDITAWDGFNHIRLK